jgi:hypothetical protein
MCEESNKIKVLENKVQEIADQLFAISHFLRMVGFDLSRIPDFKKFDFEDDKDK